MKRNLGVSLKENIVRELDLLAGPTGRSALIEDLITEGLVRRSALLSGVLQGAKVEHAVRAPGTGADQPTGLLKDSSVQHASTKHPGTGAVFVNATMIHPSPKKAADVGDPGRGRSFSVRHDLRGDQLSASAEVRGGRHRLDPALCDACQLVLRDAPGWV